MIEGNEGAGTQPQPTCRRTDTRDHAACAQQHDPCSLDTHLAAIAASENRFEPGTITSDNLDPNSSACRLVAIPNRTLVIASLR
jgi:hypothetical protein